MEGNSLKKVGSLDLGIESGNSKFVDESLRQKLSKKD